MIYLFGGLLIVGGTLVVFGAVSGRLAAMLGALVGIGNVTSGGGPLVTPVPGINYEPGDSWSSDPSNPSGTPSIEPNPAPEIPSNPAPELPNPAPELPPAEIIP